MKDKIASLIKSAGIKADIGDIIEVPKNPEMGDYALPCFPLAKVMRKNPAEIAKELASKIKSSDFERIEASGGYVNFFIDKNKLSEQVLDKVRKEKDRYGYYSGNKEKVMIEFSQPNTHKAFHVGHIRGTSLGESLGRILEFSGSNVIRVNYSGDTGMHIAKWMWCYKKFHSKEKIKADEKWFADIYTEAVKKLEGNEKGEKEVQEINRKLEARDKEILELWRKTRKMSIDSWKTIYKELDVKFDTHFFESEEERRGKEISMQLVDMGIAKLSQGAVIVDFSDHGAENLGVLVLLRNDGTVLYGAKDLALAEKKFGKYKIDRSIYVIGKAQDMHIHQVFKILELMKMRNADKCEYVPVNEIRLPWGKMSSRTGDNVLYAGFKEELMNAALKEIKSRHKLSGKEAEKRAFAISIAAMKYSMLKQDVNKGIIFNPEEEIKFEGNTGPYLLYSYARAKSILRKAGKDKQKQKRQSNIDDKEKRIISEIGKFPGVIKHAFDNLEPNGIANYAYSLSQEFNEFYSNLRVIGSEEEAFRLRIVDAFAQTLKNALNLLGIKVIEEM